MGVQSILRKNLPCFISTQLRFDSQAIEIVVAKLNQYNSCLFTVASGCSRPGLFWGINTEPRLSPNAAFVKSHERAVELLRRALLVILCMALKIQEQPVRSVPTSSSATQLSGLFLYPAGS